jgi:hypothetical protein
MFSCEYISMNVHPMGQIGPLLAVLAGLATAMEVQPAAARGAGGPPLHVQVTDSAALSVPASTSIIANAATAPVPAGLAPAPVPNLDIDAPVALPSTDPQLSPTLVSRKKTFEGDGYSHGSGQDYSLDERTPPAPGLALSVPVK